MNPYLEIIEILKDHGVHFAPGLTAEEIEKIEKFYDITFPQALRDFYACGLPVSTDEPVGIFSRDDWFPIWNDFSDENAAAIRRRMEYPVQSVLWDVENGYWRKSWGDRPKKMEDREAQCRAVFANAPKLIPVHAHRYIPQMDGVDDPPVISVRGLDAIWYGADFTDYLYREFLRDIPRDPAKPSVTVPVWSDIIEVGSGNFI